jgi:hypothetical protein
MTYVVQAVLVMAALVFGASAAAKLAGRAAFRRFRAAMASTGLLPRRLGWLVAAVLAVAELLIALGLVAAVVLVIAGAPGRDAVALTALGLAALLTCALVAGVAVLIRREVRAQCACFGATDSEPIGGRHLVRNLTLLAGLLAGLAGAAGTGSGAGQAGPAAAVVMAVVAGGCGALLLIRWEDLAVLVTPVPSIRRSRLSGPGAS